MAAHALPASRTSSRRPLTALAVACVAVLGLAALPASADPWPVTPNAVGAEVAAAASISAEVTPSSTASRVAALQHLLTFRGYETDPDGVYGSGTTASVKAFQTASGLTASGTADGATLGALIALTQNGQSGANVSAVQILVSYAGFYTGIDGAFGSGTVAIVKSFQSAKGLTADGVVGPQTWTALFTSAAGSGGDCSAVDGGVPVDQTALATNNIRVHKCFLAKTNAMIAAAAADGVTLTANSSYRSRAQQIALRKQNCGTTHYDIYDKPSGSCSPPTAKPGQSNHETGLAVDFANAASGGTVSTWLKNHAATYHFSNLPSESWHWSWDGH